MPKGLYGDVSSDKNMREVSQEQASRLTFFIYEQIDAFRQATANSGLNAQDIEDVFYNNAAMVIKSATKLQQLQMQFGQAHNTPQIGFRIYE